VTPGYELPSCQSLFEIITVIIVTEFIWIDESECSVYMKAKQVIGLMLTKYVTSFKSDLIF